MKFRTELNIPKSDFNITHQSKILAIGSCFVENIGDRLSHYNFDITLNPFGIIFNPHSIAKILRNATDSTLNYNTNFIERDASVYGYDFHSKFNAEGKKTLLTKIDSTNKKTSQRLLESNVLMLTFGTAWIYKEKTSNQVVANCHKVPQQHFTKHLLDLDDLKQTYNYLLKDIFERNKALKVMLTVSPVRHLKDGFIENNRSKSILLLLCDYLATAFPDNVIYFPAYEIVMDDLRDYRFYNSDLVHPNSQAVDYIFENFTSSFFDQKTLEVLPKIKQLNQLKQHKFLNASKEQIQRHQEKITKLETLITSTIR